MCKHISLFFPYFYLAESVHNNPIANGLPANAGRLKVVLETGLQNRKPGSLTGLTGFIYLELIVVLRLCPVHKTIKYNVCHAIMFCDFHYRWIPAGLLHFCRLR